jgi:hypothetical protein
MMEQLEEENLQAKTSLYEIVLSFCVSFTACSSKDRNECVNIVFLYFLSFSLFRNPPSSSGSL